MHRTFRTSYPGASFLRYRWSLFLLRLLAFIVLGAGLSGISLFAISDVQISDSKIPTLFLGIFAAQLVISFAVFRKARSIAARRAYGKSLETTDKG